MIVTYRSNGVDDFFRYVFIHLIDSPGVHILKDPRTGSYNFDPYLKKIVQPQDFNFDMLPGYKRPSEDSRLMDLARAHGKRFIGASSSLVGMLAQMYLLISNMKPINTTTFSHDYIHQLKTFTRLSRGPFLSLFYRKIMDLGI